MIGKGLAVWWTLKKLVGISLALVMLIGSVPFDLNYQII